MPRIVRFYETGGPEVLKIEELVQYPRTGEVLLQVETIGLNRADSMLPMHGRFFEKTKLPARLGYEASGGNKGSWSRSRSEVERKREKEYP